MSAISFQSIDHTQLVTVVGGADNSTSVDTPIVSVSSTRSNYGTCLTTAADLVAQQYPDTRPHIGPVPLPFTTDDNQAARAAATVDTAIKMCGQP
jgi:hypothetical protein